MAGRGKALIFLTFTFHFSRITSSGNLGDTLSQGQNLTIGDQLISSSQGYYLFFFQYVYDPSMGKYLHLLSPELNSVWLANVNNPLDSSAKLMIDDYGNLKILYQEDSQNVTIYSSKATNKIKATATLLNNGNLVLREMNSDSSVKQVLWQSFDHPLCTLIPGMRLGINKALRKTWNLTSWVGPNTPVLGSFTLGMNPNNTKELVIWWQGEVYWTSGPWNDGGFSNLKTEFGRHNFYFSYISNENETYFNYSTSSLESSFIFLNYLGQLNGQVSLSCNSQDNPALVSGCVPPKHPHCRDPDTYVSLVNFRYGNMSQEGYKRPETEKVSLYDCGVMCLNNCSCVAYAATTKDGTGCEMWSKETEFVASSLGRSVYFIPDNPNRKSKAQMTKLWIIIVIGGALVVLIIASVTCWVLQRKRRVNAEEKLKQKKLLYEIGGISVSPIVTNQGKKCARSERTSLEIHIFSFESIVMATDDFSSANKLGEGGFGPVYKGKLVDGQEIAIKRLSTSSKQGLTEFENEVKLIAKLQHTNLVRLHGFCIEREERILVYEYMSNKSLDFYLFDSKNRTLLNWRRRYDIVQGIAQGLVYLHRYSRLRVIHRDLKPSNILLDNEMNPKISDFGLATKFELQQSENNISRVVGTLSYMPPEYALNGIVSTKTDVYSFGVLLLEIVSGKKNASCYHSDYALNLAGYAWKLWNEVRASELIDPMLDGSCSAINQILRCIHIGLLCVQDGAQDRPAMLDVVSFLSNEAIVLAEPKQPAFFIMNTELANELKLPNNLRAGYSTNYVTFSSVDFGR